MGPKSRIACFCNAAPTRVNSDGLTCFSSATRATCCVSILLFRLWNFQAEAWKVEDREQRGPLVGYDQFLQIFLGPEKAAFLDVVAQRLWLLGVADAESEAKSVAERKLEAERHKLGDHLVCFVREPDAGTDAQGERLIFADGPRVQEDEHCRSCRPGIFDTR